MLRLHTPLSQARSHVSIQTRFMCGGKLRSTGARPTLLVRSRSRAPCWKMFADGFLPNSMSLCPIKMTYRHSIESYPKRLNWPPMITASRYSNRFLEAASRWSSLWAHFATSWAMRMAADPKRRSQQRVMPNLRSIYPAAWRHSSWRRGKHGRATKPNQKSLKAHSRRCQCIGIAAQNQNISS